MSESVVTQAERQKAQELEGILSQLPSFEELLGWLVERPGAVVDRVEFQPDPAPTIFLRPVEEFESARGEQMLVLGIPEGNMYISTAVVATAEGRYQFLMPPVRLPVWRGKASKTSPEWEGFMMVLLFVMLDVVDNTLDTKAFPFLSGVPVDWLSADLGSFAKFFFNEYLPRMSEDPGIDPRELDGRVLRVELLTELARHSPEQFEVFMASEVFGVRQADVAARLGIQQSSVSRRLSSARAFLAARGWRAVQNDEPTLSLPTMAKVMGLSRKELARRLVHELTYEELGEALEQDPKRFAKLLRLVQTTDAPTQDAIMGFVRRITKEPGEN